MNTVLRIKLMYTRDMQVNDLEKQNMALREQQSKLLRDQQATLQRQQQQQQHSAGAMVQLEDKIRQLTNERDSLNSQFDELMSRHNILQRSLQVRRASAGTPILSLSL